MDGPDWLGVAGSARYLGMITIPAGTDQAGVINFTPQAWDGAIVVVPEGFTYSTDNMVQVTLRQLDIGAPIANGLYGAGRATSRRPFVGPLARAAGARWNVYVKYYGTWAADHHWYAWTLPSVQVNLVTTNGEPMPVAIDIADSGLPGNGVPVVAAAASLSAVSVPTFGAVGGVTFPGVAGRTYRLASALFTLTNAATATIADVSVAIRDGPSGTGAIVWAGRCAIPAVAGSSDRTESYAPIAGTAGNAMTLEFSAGVANCLEYVSASVWY